MHIPAKNYILLISLLVLVGCSDKYSIDYSKWEKEKNEWKSDRLLINEIPTTKNKSNSQKVAVDKINQKQPVKENKRSTPHSDYKHDDEW